MNVSYLIIFISQFYGIFVTLYYFHEIPKEIAEHFGIIEWKYIHWILAIFLTLISWLISIKFLPKYKSETLEYLKKILSNIDYIDKNKRFPYEQLLYIGHLAKVDESVSSIKENIENQTYKKKFSKYREVVTGFLDKEDSIFVFALCGKKSEQIEQSDYFNEFYNFAKRNDLNNNEKRTVCRIFIQPENGNFDPTITKIISEHDEHYHNDVIALTISQKSHNLIGKILDYKDFCRHLLGGVGFLLLGSKSGSSYQIQTIIHQGTDDKLSFSIFNDTMNKRAIFYLLNELYKLSDEKLKETEKSEKYNIPNKDKIIKVQSLITKIDQALN